jgi:hypothetical protein
MLVLIIEVSNPSDRKDPKRSLGAADPAFHKEWGLG